MVVIFLIKEAHFYVGWLRIIPRCASRGNELSGMSAIFARENYKRSVKAQQDVCTGKSRKRFMDAVDKLERLGRRV